MASVSSVLAFYRNQIERVNVNLEYTWRMIEKNLNEYNAVNINCDFSIAVNLWKIARLHYITVHDLDDTRPEIELYVVSNSNVYFTKEILDNIKIKTLFLNCKGDF